MAHRVLFTCLLLLMALSPATIDLRAEGSGFSDFCTTWMKKLKKREQSNIKSAEIVPTQSGFMLEYVGYERKPRQCETFATGNSSNPFVGRLTYHELQYRARAYKRKSARTAKAEVVARTEIIELFRYDKTRWVY